MYLTDHLKEFPGRRLMAQCRRCGILKAFSTDAVFEALGDRQVNGLRTTFADRWGCERLLKSGWEACGLRVWIGEKIDKPPPTIMIPSVLRRWRATAADPAVRLGEFQEWDSLYAVCACGRARFLSHKDLIKRFGPEATLGELRPRLRCKANREHKNVMFAVGREKR